MARRPAKPKPSNPARPGRGIIKPPPAGSPAGYARFLEEVKSRIRTARVKAALSVNRELIRLYWSIGRGIVERQRLEGWGAAVIGRLATDIQREFPGLAGFSRANIYRMRAFHLAYPQDTAIVSQAARRAGVGAPPEPMASLPWFHNVVLLESLKDPRQRLWYARQGGQRHSVAGACGNCSWHKKEYCAPCRSYRYAGRWLIVIFAYAFSIRTE